MTKLLGVALALLLGGTVPVAAAAPATEVWLWHGATLNQLVTPGTLLALNVRLSAQFEVLEKSQIVALTAAGDLFDLTSSQSLPAKAPLNITAFTADRRLLIVVCGRRLGWYESGAIVERIQLPQDGLAIVAGPKKRLYLYGSQGTGSAIYVLDQWKGGKLLDVPETRISVLTVIGERLFFAAGNTIYTAAERQRPALLFTAAGEKAITSLAADPVSGLLYFSAGNTVYAMRAGVAVSILRGVAGVLRHAGDALYVLDPSQGVLVQVRGLEKLVGGKGLAGSADKSGLVPFKE